MAASISQLRSLYHETLCQKVFYCKGGVPNISDKNSKASVEIAKAMISCIPHPLPLEIPTDQTSRIFFEEITRDFLENSFLLIQHLRPGKWVFSIKESISNFDEYEHLAYLQRMLKKDPEWAAALGDYIMTPDILVGRYPISDREINEHGQIIKEDESISQLTRLRASNSPGRLVLHAIISCKWTIRSDRAQNIRTEALNLIRNRKGHTPHIVTVTAEPLPTRLASLALGTGDLDCVYHFALPELREATERTQSEDQLEMLLGMIDGRRLRDISDLPFDLAI